MFDQAGDVIETGLSKIPLTPEEKHFLIQVVAYGKFRQVSIHAEAGGYFGIAQSRDEVNYGDWFFFWCYPRDPACAERRLAEGQASSDSSLSSAERRGAPSYHNVHYTLKTDGSLVLTRDE